jgi:hypothetical protein
MKIVYVNTPMQDEHTENPLVIDGHTPKWCVITMAAKESQTLREFFEDRWNYIKAHPSGKDVTGFYLYDATPVGGIMDENKNITGRSALFVRFDYIKENK